MLHYLLIVLASVALAYCQATGNASQTAQDDRSAHHFSDHNRVNTCPQVAQCMSDALNKFPLENLDDTEEKALEYLRKFADTRREWAPGCTEPRIRDYINKWTRVRQLRKERLIAMEQCVRRDNAWGRGFDPCVMPRPDQMPRQCMRPFDLMTKLILGANGQDFESGSQIGTGNTWTGGFGSIRGSGSTGTSGSLIGGGRTFPGRTGSRIRRDVSHMDPASGAGFDPLDACMVDTCGCPEIQICQQCYLIGNRFRELTILEHEMLKIRLECGVQLRS